MKRSQNNEGDDSETHISERRSMRGSLTVDVIQIRLPLKTEYLQVLRAAVGAIAGNMSFNFDEITHIRVAVSAVFDLLLNNVAQRELVSEVAEAEVQFAVQPDEIEILITHLSDYTCDFDSEEEQESLALVKSLMDEVEYGVERAAVRMAKYKST